MPESLSRSSRSAVPRRVCVFSGLEHGKLDVVGILDDEGPAIDGHLHGLSPPLLTSGALKATLIAFLRIRS